jgi:ATP-dependent helicase/nuclease subunit B
VTVFHIPTHLPFLDCLAAGVLQAVPGRRAGTPVPRHHPAADAPLAAALRAPSCAPPTASALLLPRMRALAGLSTEDADELALPALLDLPPAVDPLRRQAVLTGFIQRLPRERGGPATPDQAWSLAGRWARCSTRSPSRSAT